MTFRLPRSLAAAALLLSVAGCDQFGAAAGVIAQAIPRDVDAAYKGLAGQKVVVMVWADNGVRLDNPDLQLDVAAALQDKLINVQTADHPEALKGTTFPFSSAAVVAAQAQYPEWQYQSAAQVAGKFNATRLIYVEVTDFATRSAASLELYKGTMTAHLTVVEMTDGKGGGPVTTKTGYDGGTIAITFPKDSPKDGLPNRKESQVAQGTIDAFADQVANRFYRHDEDRQG